MYCFPLMAWKSQMKMEFPSFFTCKRSFQVFFFPFFFSPWTSVLADMLILESTIFTDEWMNFLERVNCSSEEELRASEELEEELRLWASYRGQTLTKTGISIISSPLSLSQQGNGLAVFCIILLQYDNFFLIVIMKYVA